jgi:hypothetical protein
VSSLWLHLTLREMARFGYLWWVQRAGFSMAMGYGGQYVFVNPPNDIVVAIVTTMPRNSAQAIFP